MEDLTGREFGPYRIVGPLGEGGMAAVYKAYQPVVDRFIALKILPRHFATDPQFMTRFRHEAKIVAQLQHPHIVPVFDFGDYDGYTVLAMPFIQGGTLADMLHGKAIEPAVASRMIGQVLAALKYAHAKGVVHRDLKPRNILMDESGNCLVADFGIARLTEGTTKLTVTGSIMGTPEYMAPEQASAGDVSPRSDVYSVGIMLFEMLTGRVPFQGETPVAVAIKHVTAPLPSPRVFNPGITLALEAVVMQALARLPADRFDSAETFASALSDAVLVPDSSRNATTIIPVVGSAEPVGSERLEPESAAARVTAIASESATVTLENRNHSGDTNSPSQIEGPPKRPLTPLYALAAAGLVVVLGLGLYLSRGRKPSPPPAASQQVEASHQAQPAPQEQPKATPPESPAPAADRSTPSTERPTPAVAASAPPPSRSSAKAAPSPEKTPPREEASKATESSAGPLRALPGALKSALTPGKRNDPNDRLKGLVGTYVGEHPEGRHSNPNAKFERAELAVRADGSATFKCVMLLPSGIRNVNIAELSIQPKANGFDVTVVGGKTQMVRQNQTLPEQPKPEAVVRNSVAQIERDGSSQLNVKVDFGNRKAPLCAASMRRQ